MSAARAVVGFAVGAGLLALAALTGEKGERAPPLRRVYRAELPAGAGRSIVRERCMLCHSGLLVVQQAKDSTGWEKTVRLMETWGAQVAPAEHPELVRYLTAHFGARPGR